MNEYPILKAKCFGCGQWFPQNDLIECQFCRMEFCSKCMADHECEDEQEYCDEEAEMEQALEEEFERGEAK